jgi:hypothetical protein
MQLHPVLKRDYHAANDKDNGSKQKCDKEK